MEKNIDPDTTKDRTVFRDCAQKKERQKQKMSDPKDLKVFSGKDLTGLPPLDLPKFWN